MEWLNFAVNGEELNIFVQKELLSEDFNFS